MRGPLFRSGLVLALVSVSFFVLYGEEQKIPDLVLDSYNLLKKPIEVLLPDLDETPAQERLSESTPLEMEPYQDLHNQRERWNEMRTLIESGKPLFTPLPSELAISTTTAGRLAPAIPPPPGFTVQLPYESRLTVSGRKTIGVTYQGSGYSNATYATNQGLATATNNLQIQQQLQVRINGQVGRKVTVNVDFDDTKDDKKDISIVYKGDPDELVQRAAFGDITLSLPQTEFAGYNKQLFGAEVELKYKALHAYAIGSRTKGQSETKEFSGNVILQRLDILDTAYLRHKYYNVTKLTGSANDNPISLPSLTVYLDNRDSTRVTFTLPASTTVDGSLLQGAGNYTGNFVLLAQGIDYSFDTRLGVINLRTPVQSNAVIAINYPALNTRGNTNIPYKMIKFDETQIQQIPVTEDLTHYNLGSTKIVRDNGQGNFTFQLLDLNRNNVGASMGVNYLPNNAGTVNVDFEGGIFNLVNVLLPFADIYNVTPNHHLTFYTEYRARVKTYTLRPNIVINSERISLNGRILTRDVDYFIDYQSGFITFFNEDSITESSQVQATYDFSPFGIAGEQQDTLVGTRAEASFYPIADVLSKSLIGTTVLYDFAPKSAAAPDIRQTAGSFLLTEGDIHFNDLVFSALPRLKSSFAAEGARSASNPNTFGQALIDNMEGIEQDTSVNLSIYSWQIAYNPTFAPAFANALAQLDSTHSKLQNDLIPTLTINPNAAALSGDKQQVLVLNYDLAQSSEASIVTVLNPAGVDFSKKLYLQMYVHGDGTNASGLPSGTQLNITMGQINEDADGTHGGGFTDTIAPFTHPLGDDTPRTEDLNHNNTLDNGEDIGWTYFNPTGPQTPIGASNIRLDSEDLDRNGRLDLGSPTRDQNPISFVGGDAGYNSTISSFSLVGIPNGASATNTVDFSGWHLINIPLNISSATSSNWTAIKEMRISLKAGTTGGPTSGIIQIGQISVVGNKWQAQTPPTINISTISVSAVSTVNNPNYFSPPFSDFNNLNQVNGLISGPQPAKRKETSLGITYAFIPGVVGSSVTAISVSGSPMDFTVYGSIRFFLYGDNQNETFFFQAGSDTNFLQFSIPVNWIGWREIYIKQLDTTGDQRVDTWADAGGNPNVVTISSQGVVDLSSIAQLKVGVINTNLGATGGDLFVDEIFAADVITRIGYAGRLQSDFDLLGWGKFGLGVKDIDRNFQTFNSAITNQDRHESKAYLNITRLSYFPMAFLTTKSRTTTPNITQIPNSSLVSIQQQGQVDDQFYSGTGTFQKPNLPKIGLLYDTDELKTSQLFRIDHTDHYGGTLDYTVPLNKAYIPKSISAGYKRTYLDIGFTPQALGTSDPFQVSNTKDYTDDISLKLAFQPLSGFTFNPNIARSSTHESKQVLYSSFTNAGVDVGVSTETLNYDKLKSQTMGFDSNLAIKRWFAPRLRYTVTNRETYGIPLSTQKFANDLKTVDRTDTGQIDWDFAWRDFSKRARSLQSLTVSTSYLMEDGDSWNNVSGGYNTLNLLSVRQSLKPPNSSTATLQNQTLRDTFRSTQRWNPFDWATNWSGAAMPLRTLSLTSTLTNTDQRQNTTGTPSHIITKVYPDLIFSLTQTERFFNLQKYMANSQMNIKTQFKSVDTKNTSLEKVNTNGGDWRFTFIKKLDFYLSYTRTTDRTFDLINHVTSNDALSETLGAQVGFNLGRWRWTPKYDQTKQHSVGATGQLTSDLTTRTPALQLYADLFLPAGMKLPFADLVVFSNRIRTTTTMSLTQRRSSLNELQNNSDTYAVQTSEDYELTSNMRLTVGGAYSYQVNKVSSDANVYTYQFNSLLTIQF